MTSSENLVHYVSSGHPLYEPRGGKRDYYEDRGYSWDNVPRIPPPKEPKEEKPKKDRGPAEA